MGEDVSDRHFLYLDTVWVKQQLDQLEKPVLGEVRREIISNEDGVGLTLPGGSLGGSRKRQNSVEVEQQADDTPERMFARYYDHHSRAGRLYRKGPLVSGRRYELHGQITAPGVFTTEEGAEVAFALDSRNWRHEDDATGIPLALFGRCLRDGSLHAMAIYVPEQVWASTLALKVDRRRVLAGVAGAAALAVGGLAAWQALRQPAPPRFRIAGGPGEFFEDEEVKQVFRDAGIGIEQTEFGSLQIADVDLSRYDGVFPASTIVARHIQGQLGTDFAQYPSFGSPMIVMTWDLVLPKLEQEHIAYQSDGIWVFDVKAYLDSVQRKVRWGAELGERRLLLRTTDPATSNSSAMFIAIASYVLNGDNTVTDAATVAKLVPLIRPCFADQGDMYPTSRHLRRAYLDGPGAVPIGWIYENDVVEELVGGRQMRYLYPKPNVLSEHHFIPIGKGGDGERVGRLLRGHSGLIAIAQQRYGFRYGTEGARDFSEVMSGKQISVPSNPTLARFGLVQIPSTDILGNFIDALQPPRQSPA